MTFFNKYLLECLQHDISSFRLFKDDISGLHRIKYFSHKHKLHFFVKVNYISPLENLVFLCVKLCYCSTKVTCISLLIFFHFLKKKIHICLCRQIIWMPGSVWQHCEVTAKQLQSLCLQVLESRVSPSCQCPLTRPTGTESFWWVWSHQNLGNLKPVIVASYLRNQSIKVLFS